MYDIYGCCINLLRDFIKREEVKFELSFYAKKVKENNDQTCRTWRTEKNKWNNTSLCLLLYFLCLVALLSAHNNTPSGVSSIPALLFTASLLTYQELYTKPSSSISSAASTCVKRVSQNVACTSIRSIFQRPLCILGQICFIVSVHTTLSQKWKLPIQPVSATIQFELNWTE